MRGKCRTQCGMEWDLNESGIERVGVQVICGSLKSITIIRRSEIAEEELFGSQQS